MKSIICCSNEFFHGVRGGVAGRLGVYHVQGAGQSAVVEGIHLLYLNDLLSLLACQGSFQFISVL